MEVKIVFSDDKNLDIVFDESNKEKIKQVLLEAESDSMLVFANNKIPNGKILVNMRNVNFIEIGE